MYMTVKQAAEKWGISDRRLRFHIGFEGIHPFIDGNGRSVRLLVNSELMKAGYPPIDIKFTDRISYYNAFDIVKEGVTVYGNLQIIEE